MVAHSGHGFRWDIPPTCTSIPAVWYRDEILDCTVRLYAVPVFLALVLMDDNVNTHSAALAEDYLDSEGLRVSSGRRVCPTYSH